MAKYFGIYEPAGGRGDMNEDEGPIVRTIEAGSFKEALNKFIRSTGNSKENGQVNTLDNGGLQFFRNGDIWQVYKVD